MGGPPSDMTGIFCVLPLLEQRPGLHMHREKAREDTQRRWPSESQEERPQEKPKPFGLRLSAFRTVRK